MIPLIKAVDSLAIWDSQWFPMLKVQLVLVLVRVTTSMTSKRPIINTGSSNNQNSNKNNNKNNNSNNNNNNNNNQKKQHLMHTLSISINQKKTCVHPGGSSAVVHVQQRNEQITESSESFVVLSEWTEAMTQLLCKGC